MRDCETQYLDIIKDILENGIEQIGRNGPVKACIGKSIECDLRNGSVPLLTTKRVAWKTCLKELIWFCRGETNSKILEDKNCMIWKDNSTKAFLESRGLSYPEGELGPVYGKQWRRYTGITHSGETKQIDQLGDIIKQLKADVSKEKETGLPTPISRRLIVCSWNAAQLNDMALPPCHLLFQFHREGPDGLSCTVYQRSADVGLGVPFNLFSYSCLTHAVAKMTGLKATRLVIFFANTHIYKCHIDALKQQCQREIIENDLSIKIDDAVSVYEDISQLKESDFILQGEYKSHGKLPMEFVT